MITLHAESTNCMQRRSCFAIPLREQKVEYKNGGEIKKFCNYPRFLYSTRPIQPHHFQADQSGATVPLRKEKKRRKGCKGFGVTKKEEKLQLYVI